MRNIRRWHVLAAALAVGVFVLPALAMALVLGLRSRKRFDWIVPAILVVSGIVLFYPFGAQLPPQAEGV